MEDIDWIEKEAAASFELARQNGQSAIGQTPEQLRARLREQAEHRSRSLDTLAAPRDHAYGGSIKVNFGAVWGDVTARINFSDEQKWVFTADFWGFGAGSASAVGVGAWAEGFANPYENQEMEFEIFSMQSTAGILQLFWWPPGQGIVGSFIGPAAGIGVFAGGGKGRWRRD